MISLRSVRCMTVSCAVKYSYDDLHYEIYRKTKSRGTYGYRTGGSSPNCHMKLGDIRTIDLWLPGPVIGVNAAGVATPPIFDLHGSSGVYDPPNILTSVSFFPFSRTSEYRKSLSFSSAMLPVPVYSF